MSSNEFLRASVRFRCGARIFLPGCGTITNEAIIAMHIYQNKDENYYVSHNEHLTWKGWREMSIAGMLLIALIIIFAVIIVLVTDQTGKRGCGRGCATCGNREMCHKKRVEKQSRKK